MPRLAKRAALASCLSVTIANVCTMVAAGEHMARQCQSNGHALTSMSPQPFWHSPHAPGPCTPCMRRRCAMPLPRREADASRMPRHEWGMPDVLVARHVFSA